MAKSKPKLKAECIRLRLEHRMSLREIQEETGASKGSLSLWLKPHPLTETELQERKSNQRRRGKGRRRRQKRPPSSFYCSYGDKYTRLEKSKIAETAVLFRLVLNRMIPFGSVFDGDKADWLVEVPSTGRILKVQVRWALHPKRNRGEETPVVSLRCARRGNLPVSFVEGDFDILVGYDFYTDTSYVWTWGEVKHLCNSVTIHPDAAERWDKFGSS